MMNIYQSIAKIMKTGYSIAKEKDNQQQHFKYRGIDDVMNTFQPLMAEAGIFLVPEVVEHYREDRQTKNGGNLIYSIMKMKYTFYAEDGSSVSAIVIGEGMDSADKSSNKAMAVAMKYAMFQVFCIPTEEMEDPDATTPPESKPAKQAQKPAQSASNGKQAATQKPTEKSAQSAPKEPEMPSPAEDGFYYCAECNKIIGKAQCKDGSIMTPADVVAMAVKRTGKCLCVECLKKHAT